MVFTVRTVWGPGHDPARGRREQDGWDAHAAFMDGLVAAGTVLFGGPYGDGRDEVLLVVEAADEDEVRQVFAADPWQVDKTLELGPIVPWTIWLDGRG
jgi:uncharacterized protein YciI